ncbi:hypothetical protein Gorai_019203 [Gossypium raimondii]|uniref:Uncharacterized protein n=1 Tax=Gossypium raimondii TaxID=29730 RepID=A0A7J8PMS2_GOSRA|nr:hypothetical protein [Gossypium raimondii]
MSRLHLWSRLGLFLKRFNLQRRWVFGGLNSKHICRLGNRAGHLMAKEGFHWQCNSWWVEDGPVTIHDVVHVEFLHVRRVVSPQSR